MKDSTSTFQFLQNAPQRNAHQLFGANVA